ncbi:MAG: hypothetical protein J4452_00105 [Candidatus Aenigmarchaeota archaeon]|nr:hypothetical protein [Candidatus Aenigmarchaeota archaeon]
MKGVIELKWVILLIIIGGIIAFLIIVGFTYDLQKRLVDWLINFKASDLIESWQKVLKK